MKIIKQRTYNWSKESRFIILLPLPIFFHKKLNSKEFAYYLQYSIHV